MVFLRDTELKLREIQALLLDRIDEENKKEGTSIRRNFSPKVWGPPGWAFLGKIVDGYPVRASHSDQVQMLDFLTSLGHVLPCAKCRKNYIDFTFKYPPIDYVSGRAKVRLWIRAYKRKMNKN